MNGENAEMNMDERSEKLFLKYLNPIEMILPSEIHELARVLLDAYRQQFEVDQLGNTFHEVSFFRFMSEILTKYYAYAERVAVERRINIEEHKNILKWWKEMMAVPSIQGVLVMTPYVAAAPILKLAIVAGYFVKEKWNKRNLRELLKNLSEEIIEGRSIKDFSERTDSYESAIFRKAVGSADVEVDELALILEEARSKIYWRVERRQKWG